MTQSDDTTTLQDELASVDFSNLIGGVGRAIAEAQYELDMTSIRIAQVMAGEKVVGGKEVKLKFGENKKKTLLELGFTPTFYQFVDTIIEIKVSFNVSRMDAKAGASMSAHVATGSSVQWPLKARAKVKSSVVSAAFASRYQYSAEGSSLVRTKLVPIPAPALLQEMLQERAAELGKGS